MKLLKIVVITLALFVAGTSTLCAGEIEKEPLDEVFDNVVIVPFDYHDKVFLNGKKTEISGEYEMHMIENRVMVPIRLMGYLAGKVGSEDEYWQAAWEPQKPDDVVLVNHSSGKTVKLKVNSSIMYINEEPQKLDIPPQKINGRIVLPLRNAMEALDKKVEWLDGLIIIGNHHIDLENPGTLDNKDSIKEKLNDDRKVLDYEKRLSPIGRYENTIYYLKEIPNADPFGTTQNLYKKSGKGQEVKIELPGEERFGRRKVIDNELYYYSKINDNTELHVFNFAENKSRKLCVLKDWCFMDGWIPDMKYIDNEFYIILHFGDCTMCYEKLYKLENGELKEIVRTKTFAGFDAVGDYVYYTDFRMFNTTENLFRYNIKTKEKEDLGEEGFSYGIYRKIEEGRYSFSKDDGFYIQDGFIYTLGYKENDEEDKNAVYKISISDGTHQKMAAPAKTFWLIDNKIYYIDLNTDFLMQVDLQGNNKETLIDRKIIDIKFSNGDIYYTAVRDNKSKSELGKFYKYSFSDGREMMLSDKYVSEFFAGSAGVYYEAEGYDLGLYKVNDDGENECIIDDSVHDVLLTDYGLLYTLDYEEGLETVLE